MAIRANSSLTLPQPGSQSCLAVDGSAAGWAFGSPQEAHFYLAADVVVDDTPPMPPSLASRRSPWSVGFIQNVLSDTTNLSYDGGTTVTTSVTRPCLDASTGTVPWYCGRVNDVLTYGQIQGVNSFWYQGPGTPVRFGISMADWPRFTVYNFLRGGTYPSGAGPQLRRVECTRHFRTWIAAREEMNPANVASSYVLLQMIDLAIRVTITLGPTGVNPLFEQEYRAVHVGTGTLPGFASLRVSTEYGTVAGGRFQQGRVRWGAARRGAQPVVTPPLANDFYPAQLHGQNSGVAPRTLSLTAATRCI